MSQKKNCCRGFGLAHPEPHLFYISQWQSDRFNVGTAFFMYRCIVALFFGISYVLQLIDGIEGIGIRYEFIYLTNQGLLILLIYEMLQITLVVYERQQERRAVPPYDSMPLFYKTVWLFKNLGSATAIFIVIFFWLFVYDTDTSEIDYFNIFVHGLNAVMVLVDLAIAATPFRWNHCYIPLLYGCLYGLFTWIYYDNGGTDEHGNPYIYAALNWENPRSSIVLMAVALGAVIAIHLGLAGLYAIKLRLWNDKGKRVASNKVNVISVVGQDNEAYVDA